MKSEHIIIVASAMVAAVVVLSLVGILFLPLIITATTSKMEQGYTRIEGFLELRALS